MSYTIDQVKKMKLVPHTISGGRVLSVRATEDSAFIYPAAALGVWPHDRRRNKITAVTFPENLIFWATVWLKPSPPITEADLLELKRSLADKLPYSRDRAVTDPYYDPDPYSINRGGSYAR